MNLAKKTHINELFGFYENEIELAVISNSPNFHNLFQLDKLIK